MAAERKWTVLPDKASEAGPGMRGQGWSSHETELMVRYLLGSPGLWSKAMATARAHTDNPHAVADTLHEDLVPASELRALVAAGWDPSKVNWLEIAHELIERAPDPMPKTISAARHHVHGLDLAGTCTGPGPCDTTPTGTGQNWVTSVGGLPFYVRAIVHALKRAGHPEQDAVRLAVGIVERWARGQGNVTPATRARAAKTVAEWEAKRAAAHAKSHSLSRSVLMPIDLTAGTMAARMMPDKAHVIAVAKKVEKWPEGPRKANMKRVIAARAKTLGMKPDGDGDFDYDVAAKADLAAPANTGVADAAMLNTAARDALAKKGKALPGGRFPVRNKVDLQKAIRSVGRSKTAHAAIRRYLIGRATALGMHSMIPDNWQADGTLKAAA